MKSDEYADKPVTCSVCGRAIATVEEAPFTIQEGDCINTVSEMPKGRERIVRVERIVHAE